MNIDSNDGFAFRMTSEQKKMLIKSATAYSKRNKTTLNIGEYIRAKVFNEGEFKIERKRKNQNKNT